VIHLQAALIRLNADFRALRLHWALLGGLAVSVHSEPRTTRDLDVAIVVSGDPQAERVIISLRDRGYREYPLGTLLERKDMDRMAGARLLAPGEDDQGLVVDLLFASSGVEPEIVAMAQVLEVFPGVAVPVILPGHLLALKVLAGRPKDLEDARGLLRAMDQGEVQRARETLVLIDKRGFHRGKDLLVEMARLLATA
jgi:hypothetical protein